MTPPRRFGLSEAEMAALIVEQGEMIERMAARITELEALVGKPRKTSSNSSIPPSKDGFGRARRPSVRGARGRHARAGLAL
jgi:transposase